MTAGSAARLDAYLDHAAAVRPHQPAVVDPISGSLTYHELVQYSDRIATFLRDKGIGPGSRVALIMGKRCEAIGLLFGVLKAGAAYVPIDPAGGTARLQQILDDCAPGLLCCDSASADRLYGIPALDTAYESGSLPAIRPDADLSWIRLQPLATTTEPAPTTPGEQLAYLLYTSGSTGKPKGVRLTHTNAGSFAEWAADEFLITPDDRIAGFTSLHFDISVFDIFATVRSAATLYLVPDELAASPRHIPDFLVQHGITVWYSTPSILKLATSKPGIPTPDTLRVVLFAGEVFPIPALRRVTELWPKPDYFNLYGPTETNVCTFAPIPTPIPEDRTEPYPIGHACSHCRTLIVDDHNQPVPAGRPGLLCISGPSVSPGYWNSTRDSTFVHEDERWYNTGDVVRPTDDGLVFCGRRDRMVKRSGVRIELDEIEATLVRCPGVIDAAVIANTDDGATTITAFVVGDAPIGQVALRRFCLHQLGPRLVPDRFRQLDRLPQTSTNKTDYQRLKAWS